MNDTDITQDDNLAWPDIEDNYSVLHVNCPHVLVDEAPVEGVLLGAEGVEKALEAVIGAAKPWEWCTDAVISTSVGPMEPQNFSAIVLNDSDGDADWWPITITAQTPGGALHALGLWRDFMKLQDLGEDPDQEELEDWEDDNPYDVVSLSEGLPFYRSGRWSHVLSVGHGHFYLCENGGDYSVPESK